MEMGHSKLSTITQKTEAVGGGNNGTQPATAHVFVCSERPLGPLLGPLCTGSVISDVYKGARQRGGIQARELL